MRGEEECLVRVRVRVRIRVRARVRVGVRARVLGRGHDRLRREARDVRPLK